MKKAKVFLIGIVLILTMGACGSADTGTEGEGGTNPLDGVPPTQGVEPTPKPPEVPKPKGPITITLFTNLSDEEVNTYWTDYVEKKFDHITLKHLKSATGATIEDLIALGTIPDIIRVAGTLIQTQYLDLGLGYDLNELIKMNNYDLNQFESLYFKQLANNAGTTKGETYGLPINLISPYILYYNKELFNKFGVDYPVDGMTWDETYEIAKSMTRIDGDVTYQGFSAMFTEYLRDNQMAIPALDPQADRMYDTAQWLPLFRSLMRFYQIPNNEIGASSGADQNKFIKDQTAAMLVSQLNTSVRSFPETLDWDMVSLPVFQEKPNAGAVPPPAYFTISQQSKQKEEAFEVIQYLLSKEVQMEHSKAARGTSLVDSEVRKAFGQDNEILKTKNISAIFYHTESEAMPARADGLVAVQAGTTQKIISDAFIEAATQQSDVNTALRNASEKIDQEIEKLKNQ